MEKLIELLNEFSPEDFNWCEIDGKIFDKSYEFWDTPVNFEMWVYIISKQFWFIKWLVENDKIDREKFWNSETKSSKYSDFELSYDTPREDYTNTLLMELAIQDEPIQFLIELLR